jgi:hypothetical protein
VCDAARGSLPSCSHTLWTRTGLRGLDLRVTDAASLTDWISAGSNALAAIGTIGAFATGFILIKRERDLARSSRIAGVHAFWQRTGNSVDGSQVLRNMHSIYISSDCRRNNPPTLRIAGPDRNSDATRWYTYELHVENPSATSINTVEVLIPVHDGLGVSPGRWHSNTCPIAAAADAAPMLQDGRNQYFGFSMRRAIESSNTKLVALVAYPSRIAFPEPVEITFIDGNGQQWRRAPDGDVQRTLSSSRKAAWRRRPWRRQPDRYYWRRTLAERDPDAVIAST